VCGWMDGKREREKKGKGEWTKDRYFRRGCVTGYREKGRLGR